MKYTKLNYPTSKTVTLQAVGHIIGTPANDIKPGDVLMWNFAQTTTVLDIVKETKYFITVKTKSKTGFIGVRKLKKTRLVVILEN